MDEFLKNAKGYSRNPLGIIALFISLIYGFACLVLGTSAGKLQPDEKYPLILFLVFFPVLVLFAFVYLVIWHHKKLYAPFDFRDDKSFLETTDKNNKNEELLIEYNLSTNQDVLKDSNSDLTDLSAKEKKSSPVIERPKFIEFNDFKEKYDLIERSALKRIESVYCSKAERNVRIKGLQKAEFDGVIIKTDEILFIEVKYTRSLTISEHIINSIRLICSQLVEFSKNGVLDRKIKLIIYIVFEVERLEFLFKQIQNLENELKNNFIEIIFYKDHFDSLKKEIEK